MDTRTSPFLEGSYAPIHHEATARDLNVSGRLPEELDGIFAYIGPNPLRPPVNRGIDRYQWFTQDGMVTGIRLEAGRAAWFRNRWIRSRRVARTLGERRPPGPRHFPIDTVNTNLIVHQGMLLALVETGCLPAQLSRTLDTLAYTDLSGALPRGFSAHPKLDPATGELHALAASPLRSWADYLVLDANGAAVHTRRIPLNGRPLLHDIALTPHHALFFDSPVQFTYTAAVRGRFPYRWQDGHRTRLGVIPRPGTPGEFRWYDIAPGFVFHTIHAQEALPGRIELTAVRYDRLFDAAHEDPLTGQGALWHWALDLTTGKVTATQLGDLPHELPRSDPRLVGQPIRYYYAVSAHSRRALDTHEPESLIKHDFRSRQPQVRALGADRATTEPVFIPREGSRDEDAGWIAYLEHDRAAQTSDLVVLDAQDFTGPPAAVVHLPIRVPLGSHSNWFRTEDITPADIANRPQPPAAVRPHREAEDDT